MEHYLHRSATGKKKGWHEPTVYHLLSLDGETSRCGKVKAGEFGYAIVERDRPVLRALTCNNCSKLPLR